MDQRIDQAIAEISARSHGLVGQIHLDLLDVSHEAVAHRVARGRWIRVHDGVYRVAGAPRSWEADVLAACWAGGTRACASHRSAAALHGLPGGRRDVVEITCPRWHRARHDGLITHESPPDLLDDVVLVQGIPCTSVERTLFDIAALGRTRTLELAIDSALRRELTSVDSLVHTGKRLCRRGRIGSALFRSAVATRERSAPLPGSEPERLLAMALVEQGLAQPELQYVVRDPDGAFVARVDLAYPEDRILIEYDSYQEHTGKLALVRDSARRNAVTALGFHMLTATAEDLRDHATALSRAIRRLRSRSA
jgi:predicted transcriptional regulator of viral defense system